MCGFCTEEIALDIARNGESWKSPNEDSLPFEICLFLQETQNLNTALEIVNDIVDDPGKLDPTIADVILCRLICSLFQNGYDSDYQELLKNKVVQWAIETRCSPEMKEAVGRLDFPLVAEGLMKLYDPEIYFHEREWNRFISNSFLINDCRKALQFYVDWWLKGKGLQKDSPTVSYDGATLVDYLNERNENECLKFELQYRVFFFSLLVISRSKGHRKLTQEIESRNPYYMPDFFGMDLWLKRVAVKSL